MRSREFKVAALRHCARLCNAPVLQEVVHFSRVDVALVHCALGVLSQLRESVGEVDLLREVSRGRSGFGLRP